MTLHREGTPSIIISFIVGGGLIYLGNSLDDNLIWVSYLLYALAAFIIIIILQFFRYPARQVTLQDNAIIAPADGKVVVIEDTVENEYFKDKRKQVSIFMSPVNVHCNWYPFKGSVSYYRYHPGKFLVAWHPKSSTDNERTTVVVKAKDGREVLLRQIAGAMARRIVCYAKEGEQVDVGDQMGFIKFGSRVDLYLPLDAEVKVNLDQKVTGKKTVIAQW